MTGHMTGIGNYSFHLLKALISSHPELDYCGFGLARWSRFDAASLREVEERKSKGEIATGPTIQQILGARLLRYASRSTTARLVYHALHAASFARTVRHQSLDLFHALSFVPPADPGVVTLPVVYDLSFVRYPATHPEERLKWLDRLPALIAKAPSIQTISEFSRNEIASVYGYPKDQIFVAPPAAAAIFRPLGAEETRRGLSSLDLLPGAYLLAVGTLEPRKNLSTLIAAYAQLSKTERSRIPLAIAGGKGWGNVNLPKQTSGLLQEGSLRFLGIVSDAQLRNLYEGAVALCFPSIYEGFGMPVVEAMSCGTNVIHSKETSMDEISADLGLALQATDVDSWTNALRNAIERAPDATAAERQKRVAHARTFDWATSAARVRDVYADLVG
jgi:glycosyltransferase involved in cell wall biosynthesis